MKFTRNALLTGFATAFMSLASMGAAKAHNETFKEAGALTCIEGVPDFGQVTLISQKTGMPSVTIKMVPGLVPRDVWSISSPSSDNQSSRYIANVVSAYMASAKNQCERMTVEIDPLSPGLDRSFITLKIASYP